jgi:hypothetical protein
MLRDVSFPERGETWDGSQVSIRLRYSRIRTQYSWICIETLKHWCPAGNIDRMRFMLELLFVSKSGSLTIEKFMILQPHKDS